MKTIAASTHNPQVKFEFRYLACIYLKAGTFIACQARSEADASITIGDRFFPESSTMVTLKTLAACTCTIQRTVRFWLKVSKVIMLLTEPTSISLLHCITQQTQYNNPLCPIVAGIQSRASFFGGLEVSLAQERKCARKQCLGDVLRENRLRA